MGQNANNPIAEQVIGKVKFFNGAKNFGFLSPYEIDQVDDDIFFHISDYHADVIGDNWWMKFDVIETKKGYRANNLSRTRGPSEAEEFNSTHQSNARQRERSEPVEKADKVMAEMKANQSSEDKDDEGEESDSNRVVGSKNNLINRPL
jgi:cold shock CspA family protein